MYKSSIKILVVSALVFVLAGCAVRRYTQVRERVDQDMGGNAGYMSGAVQPEDRSHIRKTRKTYVVEFSTKAPAEKEDLNAGSTKTTSVRSSESYSTSSEPYSASSRIKVTRPAPVAPVIEDTAPSSGEYTIEKGDTLQKISKKFYDTYRKWNVIYEANKERIKDPNRIKEGTVIVIPQ